MKARMLIISAGAAVALVAPNAVSASNALHCSQSVKPATALPLRIGAGSPRGLLSSGLVHSGSQAYQHATATSSTRCTTAVTKAGRSTTSVGLAASQLGSDAGQAANAAPSARSYQVNSRSL